MSPRSDIQVVTSAIAIDDKHSRNKPSPFKQVASSRILAMDHTGRSISIWSPEGAFFPAAIRAGLPVVGSTGESGASKSLTYKPRSKQTR